MDDPAATPAEEIFAAAVELHAAEREAFLALRCGSDVRLRETVRELLAAHDAAGSFLNQPMDRRSIAGFFSADFRGVEEGTLERYCLIERVGEGAMGVVWRAEQTHGIQRQVAVKILKDGFATTELLRRFNMERQALARMNHPNVAHVFDAGATSTGRPFFAMEFVAGQPIASYCDEHRLTIHERLRLFQYVCDAIQHAHQKGIMHRDLKPGNILVEEQEDVARPKVIDFGLAKAIADQPGDTGAQTMIGMMVGTPVYMSPEQARLGHQDVDTRTDIFSLGVLLFELLTGTTPLLRESVTRLSLHAALDAVARNDPPAPSQRLRRMPSQLVAAAAQRKIAPSALIATLQGDLDWIVLKALEKDRSRRYQTVGEFSADLARHLAHEPVLARAPSAGYRLRKFVRRHRLGVGLAAGLVAASLAGAAVSLALMLRARDSEAELSAFVAFLTDDVLSAAKPTGMSGGLGVDVTVRDALAAAREKVAERFGTGSLSEALTRHALGVTFDTLGDPARAVAELERAAEVRRRLLGDDDRKTLQTLSSLGHAYLEAGRIDAAVALLRGTLERQETALGPGHVDTITTMIMLGKTYSRADSVPNIARAIAVSEEALERATRTFGVSSPKRFACMVQLGGAYFQAARFAEAAALHEQALEGFRATYASTHPVMLGVMNDLAFDYLGLQRFPQAITLRREVMAQQKEQFGEEHPVYLASLASLAYVCLAARDYTTAEVAARQCYEQRRRLRGDAHFETVTVRMTLLQSLLGQSRHDVAEPIAREILALREATKPTEWRTQVSRLLLGESLLGLGRIAEAEPLLNASLASLDAVREDLPVWSSAIEAALERIVTSYSKLGDTARLPGWQQRQQDWSAWSAARRTSASQRFPASSTSTPKRHE